MSKTSLQGFLSESLGPASLERFKDPSLLEEYEQLLQQGIPLEDAALRILHRESVHDSSLAHEFFTHFLRSLERIGHFSSKDQYKHFYDTDDLVNSVASDLWRDLNKVEFRTRAEFMAYIGKRVRWKMSDRAKGFGAERRREDLRRAVDFQAGLLPPEDQPGPSTIISGSEEQERLRQAILSLPQRDREVLLRQMKGESLSEIAEFLGVNQEALRKIIQRAREKLRALMASWPRE